MATQEAINAAATAAVQALNANGVSNVAFRVPQFWKASPAAWFVRFEAAITISGITSDDTKYAHLVASLPEEVGVSVRHRLTEITGNTGKYDKLKQYVLDTWEKPTAQRLSSLLDLRSLGDMRPSQMAQHILQESACKQAAGQDNAGQACALHTALWLKTLPADVRTHVAGIGDKPLTELAKLADEKWSAVGGTASINAIESYPSCCGVSHRETDHDSDSNRRGRSPSRKPNKKKATGRSKSRAKDDICYYHGKFGEEARNCRAPCKYSGN